MSVTVRIAGCIGLLVLIGLVLHEGAATILQLLASAGWILLLIVPFHAIPLYLDTLGWRCLLEEKDRPSSGVLFVIAAIRESVNRLLPVANIGGELVGVRLLALRGIETTRAAASIIVELFLTLVSLCLFVAFGVLCLIHVTNQPRLVHDVTLWLAITVPLLVLLVVLLRNPSTFALLGQATQRLIGRFARRFDIIAWSMSLNEAMRSLFQTPLRLCAAVLYQIAGLLIGALETWLVLRWVDQPVSMAASIALEATTQAVRHFIFFVPAGLGAQEAALMGVAALLGIPQEAALALSLAKRMREVLFGLPALLGWQWIEARALTPKRSGRLQSGSAEHRQLLAQFFVESHLIYVPEQTAWPALDEVARARLVGLPFWQEAVSTENVTSCTVAAAAALEPDADIRAAIALQGIEERRHAQLLACLTAHYGIPVSSPVPHCSQDIEHDFLFCGFGECFDSFFAFGLFELARNSKMFDPRLVELFEPVVQEEARHILFFVNWVQYRRTQLPWWRRPAFRLRCGWIILKQIASRIGTARNLGKDTGNESENFTLSAHQDLSLDVSVRRLIELCLAENDRRLGRYDARLARPRLVPTVARLLHRLLPASD
ncbi:flippase-like domain-containing protein [Steroidobacter cummioxidans]|uniref:flippase-like domain-containing protein n=1 Tax=Steroidobacter cummioxidans TaxID=1803913 RepID=UPI000E31D89D|nr:flippase-like domain-containing protein [Steroidobacter cummioxidans]